MKAKNKKEDDDTVMIEHSVDVFIDDLDDDKSSHSFTSSSIHLTSLEASSDKELNILTPSPIAAQIATKDS